jgi:hypothetical protein
MDKTQRSYVLNIEDQNGDVLRVEPPFTIDFDVFRNTMSSANITKIRIYNLNEEQRNRILKNPLQWQPRLVTLRAGYGTNLPMILNGYITQCFSMREGTQFVTTIESFDSGYAYSNAVYSGPAFPAGTKKQTIVETLIKSLEAYGVGIGYISDLGTDKITRAKSITGSTIDRIREETDEHFFIDNGLAYVVIDLDAIEGPVDFVNYETGLLNTPLRNETYLNFDLLFEPRLIMGQKLFVESQTARNYTGNYKVVSIHHRGTISQAIGGVAITSVGCLAGDYATLTALRGF